MRFILYFSLLLLLPACVKQKQADTLLSEKRFHFSQFLNDQAALLNKKNPEIIKTVQTGNTKPEVKRLSQVNWQKELELFQDADLSKPALDGVYTITEKRFGPYSEKTYEKRPEEDALVQKLVLKTDTLKQVQYLDAFIEQDNLLYFSKKQLSVQIENIAKNPIIKSYQVKGMQKIIFTDSLSYSLHTIIN